MISSALHDAILARNIKIPIVDTLRISILTLCEGYCETRVARQPSYDKDVPTAF
jgi:hypothetical protein